MRSIVHASGLLALGFGLISLSLEGDVSRVETPPGKPEQAPVAAAAESVRPPASIPWDEADEVSDPAFSRAASALRQRRCGEAQEALAPRLASDGDRGRFARLVSGFYAHACEDVALATERLSEAAEPGALLEDWRLYLLAQSAHALGDEPAARRALAELLADHRDSPVWEKALLTAVEQRLETDDPAHALELVRWSREQEHLAPSTIARIETLAWELAESLGDLAVRARAARRLLTHAPGTAAELGVVEIFRHPGGRVAWRAILTGAELERRAEALLEGGLVAGALETLADVPERERSLSWTLLRSRALRADDRGGEALAALEGTRPADAAERSAVEWARAEAYADLSTPLGGGARLSGEERRRMRHAAHEHWARVVDLGGDPGLSRRALERLFGDHASEDRFEAATQALRVLRRLDPEDTTGAPYLWGLGWREYRRGNFTGAVGYWTELLSLYPGSREARSGRYWTGRAFERLGHGPRARSVFREIAAADTTDFYRKHALARLELPDAGPAPSPTDRAPDRATAEPPAEQPWPVDPELARARLLTDLGLDELALVEIEEVGETAGSDRAEGGVDPRARNALTGLALSRQGRHRAGIPHLRRAFPALGGPYQASVPAEARRLYYPLAFEGEIRPAAERSGVPSHLVYGIIREESAFDVTALSRAGARGLMQVMPATGREVARKLGLGYSVARLDEPAYNVRLGTAYFGDVLRMFDGKTELALAGYNGGPYRMKRLWREAGPRPEMDYFLESLPVEESKNYVKRVLVFTDSYEQMYGM